MLRAFVIIVAGFSLKYYEHVLLLQNKFEPSNFMRLRSDSPVMYKTYAAAVGHFNAISCFPHISLSKSLL